MMKYDELKDYDIMDIEAMDDERLEKSESGKIQVTRVYIKSDVDAAIAELKEKLRYHCTTCPVKEQEDDVVSELKKDLEDAKATAYAESVDAGMRERRLKRALWLARTKRAEARKNYWYVRSIHEGDENLWSIDGSAVKYIGCIKRSNFDWLKLWSEVECKCLAKAEEYK